MENCFLYYESERDDGGVVYVRDTGAQLQGKAFPAPLLLFFISSFLPIAAYFA